MILSVHINEHLRDSDRGKCDVHEGQVAEEEVNGGVEARAQLDEQGDEYVAQHHGQVHAQEQGKEHSLLLWPDWEPQEEELRHRALFLTPRAPFLSAGMNIV